VSPRQIAFPFGPWEPDKDAIDVGICTEALNVFPKGGPQQPWYGPIPSLKTDSALVTQLPDLANPARGIHVSRRADGTVRIFAATTQKWYMKVGNSWVDVSGALTPDIPNTDYWQYQQFGDKTYVSSYASGLHSFDMAAGSDFVNVTGGPKAKYISAFGPFMVAGCNKDNPDDLETFEFRNSAIEDPDEWTVGTNLSDMQILPDGGQITGLVPATGNDGYIIQERKIRRAIFQPGADIAFRIETVEERKGSAIDFSAVGVGGTVFYRSEDGFYAFGPQGLQAIGATRVNEWFRSVAAESRLDRTLGFVDTFSTRVGWAFYTDASLNYPNHVLYYDWQLNRWTHSNQGARVWASSAAEIILDAMTSVPHLAAIGVGRQLQFQNGDPLTAIITTGRAHFMPGGRAFVSSFYPVGKFNQDDVTVRVGKTPTPSGYMTWSDPTNINASTGIARVRSSGRIHQASITITHDTNFEEPWEHCQGVEATVVPDGLR
jgi:hypothetical protein